MHNTILDRCKIACVLDRVILGDGYSKCIWWRGDCMA